MFQNIAYNVQSVEEQTAKSRRPPTSTRNRMKDKAPRPSTSSGDAGGKRAPKKKSKESFFMSNNSNGLTLSDQPRLPGKRNSSNDGVDINKNLEIESHDRGVAGKDNEGTPQTFDQSSHGIIPPSMSRVERERRKTHGSMNLRVRRDTQDGVTPRSRKKMEQQPSHPNRPTTPGCVTHESGWNTSTQLREIDYHDCNWWFSNTEASMAAAATAASRSSISGGTLIGNTGFIPADPTGNTGDTFRTTTSSSNTYRGY